MSNPDPCCTYSIKLSTQNADEYGQLQFNLWKDDTHLVWSGIAAATGSWSYTISAGQDRVVGFSTFVGSEAF